MRITIDSQLTEQVQQWQQLASDRLGAAVDNPSAVVSLCLRVCRTDFERWLKSVPGSNESPTGSAQPATGSSEALNGEVKAVKCQPNAPPDETLQRLARALPAEF